LAREGLPDKAANVNIIRQFWYATAQNPAPDSTLSPVNRDTFIAFTATASGNQGSAVKFKLVSAMFGLILSMMLLLAVAVFFVLFSELAAM